MIHPALTRLAQRELGAAVLVGIVDVEHGERIELIGEYGAFASATLRHRQMIDAPASIDAQRRRVLRELLLTSQLADVEHRLGLQEGGF